ncbi:hypothetical protein EJB05_42739, partial [Eragrostis curvula]
MVVAGAGLRRVLGALWFLATLLLRLGVAGNAAVASVDGRRGGDDGRGLGVRDIGLVAAGEMQLRRLHLGRRIPPQPGSLQQGLAQCRQSLLAADAPAGRLAAGQGTPKLKDVSNGTGADTHLIERILDPSYLDKRAKTFSNLQGILNSAGKSTVAWVGEAGGAYKGGRHLVTDSFVFNFWFLDQLGMSAKYDTKTYCRQSLIGGNYGLLNRTTFQPNPDYYSYTYLMFKQRIYPTLYCGIASWELKFLQQHSGAPTRFALMHTVLKIQ